MFQELDTTTLAIVFISLAIAITVHEAMHAFTSHWLGDDTAEREGRISLNPLRHIDPFSTIILPIITLLVFHVPLLAAKPVPFNPNRVKFEEFGAAIVALAGPFTNLVLAASSAGILNLFGSINGLTYEAIYIFMLINIGLFVFNMIPLPPLDGSRLLFALAPEPLQRFMATLEQFGIVIIFTFVLVVPGFGDAIVHINLAIKDFLLAG